MATAILCMFWSSWLHSHCITSLAASNLQTSIREQKHLGVKIFCHKCQDLCMWVCQSFAFSFLFCFSHTQSISYLLNGTSCKMRSLHRESRQFFCSCRDKNKTKALVQNNCALFGDNLLLFCSLWFCSFISQKLILSSQPTSHRNKEKRKKVFPFCSDFNLFIFYFWVLL